jgi:hypothetical protein
MMFHKLFIVALLAMTLPAAALEDTPENRAAQIDRYLTAIPPKALFDDMINKMVQQMPPEHREGFRSLMLKNFDFNVLTTSMRAAMLKVFTADELAALADFYSSPLGKSAMSKMGDYMAQVMPAMTAEIGKATQATAKEIMQQQKQ